MQATRTTEEQFPFPFPPYPIQNEFMKRLYECLENSNLAIFESPTGTGKSMSIICGALKWLLDHEKSQREQLDSAVSELDDKIERCVGSSEHWFFVQTEQIRLSEERRVLRAKLDTILRYERKKNAFKQTCDENVAKAKKIGQRAKEDSVFHAEKENVNLKDDNDDIQEELLLEESVAAEHDPSGDEEDEEQEANYENTKIFFCSRTRSQLSQFVRELKNSPYKENLSVVTLASRQNYCVNPGVKKLKRLNLIDEQCLRLRKKKATVRQEKDIKKRKLATTRCPFLPGDPDLLIGDTISEILDVEEVAKKGEHYRTCAYYASRKAVPYAQLVLTPYNSILHKNTRISSGIDLKGNVLIIDEAHNLLEAIEAMHNATITGRNLLHCYSQLSQYQKRYQSFFSPKTVLSLTQLSFCLKKLLTVFGATTKSNPEDAIVIGGGTSSSTKLYKVEEFEVATEIDAVNIFELLKFVKDSRLHRKLQSFAEQYGNNVAIRNDDTKTSGVTHFLQSLRTERSEAKRSSVATTPDDDSLATEEEERQRSNDPLTSIVNFLECLKTSCADGRIFFVPGPTLGQSVLKFLLLNPAAHFHDVVRDARAVILAGGTMAPLEEFTEQLFVAAGASPDRIVTFSCDHVVPQENILCNVVTRGPTGVQFQFNYQNRHNVRLLDELGRALVNLCNVVPAGIVVFLPSYGFEQIVYEHFNKTGVISKISSKKCVFREPKLASQVNDVLEQYARRIEKPQSPQNGSLLFSVMGGKLSEGLNFSDDLGRCVIVVGMPYPNCKSLELQEKIKYLNENVKPDAGQNFYENACMKAVNQCIGRAIRHVNDYSTVLLFDERYDRKIKALPRWIQRAVVTGNAFGNMIGNVAKFFIQKRNETAREKVA